MRRVLALAALVLFAAAPVPAAEEAPKPLWLAVAPAPFGEALAPLVAHRAAEGFDARVLPGPVADALAAAGRTPAYLVLVGDEVDGAAEDLPWRLPSPRRELYRWTPFQHETFAADALYGDTDGDLAPDFPVGRIPARTPDDVERAVAKILAFEKRPTTADDLRVLAWGGAPGYGDFIDSMATGLLVSNVRRLSPPWADRYLLSSAASSPFCGWPFDQPSVFDRELKRGAVLGAILAHAGPERIFGMEYAGKLIHWDGARVRADFATGEPLAPVVLLACSAGSFTRPERCLAEELLFLPGGPVAAIAATTESHPLTNYYTGQGLLRALGGADARLGDAWLAAQRSILPAREFLIEKALADAEGSLEEDIDIRKLKRDQLLMYALLGDPATKLHRPDRLDAKTVRTKTGWRFSVEKPAGATTLVVGVRRPAGATAPAAGEGEEPMRAALAAANAAERYETVETLGADEPWEGTVEGGGELRLVATTPAGVLVFTTPSR